MKKTFKQSKSWKDTHKTEKQKQDLKSMFPESALKGAKLYWNLQF